MSGRSYPSQPIPAVGAFIIRDGKILLIRRAYEPCAGKWSVPGGTIKLGETTIDALKREVFEELGVKLKSMKLLDIYDYISRDEDGKIKYHYVIIDFLVNPESFEIKPSNEILEYEFFARDEALKMVDLVSSVRVVIERHPEIFEDKG
ncbi:MAG TPA: NUDIX domain-containing protein [Nitrososphaeria archaeon]|nr:NUDIX domain-containing protein [Nitrososphaeria archaeon]